MVEEPLSCWFWPKHAARRVLYGPEHHLTMVIIIQSCAAHLCGRFHLTSSVSRFSTLTQCLYQLFDFEERIPGKWSTRCGRNSSTRFSHHSLDLGSGVRLHVPRDGAGVRTAQTPALASFNLGALQLELLLLCFLIDVMGMSNLHHQHSFLGFRCLVARFEARYNVIALFLIIIIIITFI